MAYTLNLLDFPIGQTIRFTVAAKERDGTILDSPASATFTLNIATSASTVPIYTFNTTPEITMTDAGTSLFTVVLPAATIPLIVEGTVYRYDIYTTASATGDVLHQVGGALVLQPGVELV